MSASHHSVEAFSHVGIYKKIKGETFGELINVAC